MQHLTSYFFKPELQDGERGLWLWEVLGYPNTPHEWNVTRSIFPFLRLVAIAKLKSLVCLTTY